MRSLSIDSLRSATLALLLALALPWAAAAEGAKRESDARPAGPTSRGVSVEGGERPAPERPFRGWQESFPAVASVQAAGEYQGGAQWNLESFSALCLEPSGSGQFRFGPIGDHPRGGRVFEASRIGEQARTHLIFEDTVSALAPNEPGSEHFYKRAEGTISALGWVDENFRDVVVTGLVNTEGGPKGKGSVSRQGLMARWDRGNNFYWFHIDFSLGEYSVLRGRYFGLLQPLEGSTGKIAGFDNTKAYALELALVGDSVRGKVFDPAQGRGKRAKPVGDTGWVRDNDPHFEGVSGFLAEPALKEAWAPLHSSFANLASRALGPQPEKSVAPAVAATAPSAKEAAEKAQAEYEQAVALRNAGREQEALDHYYAALRLKPDFIAAMNDVAWIRATTVTAGLREPKEAVYLAEKALDIMIKTYNRRRETPAGAEAGFAKIDLIRLGTTLGAALAADGVFEPEAPEGWQQERSIAQAPVTATADQTQEALQDSEWTECASSAAQWAYDFAVQEHKKNPGPRTAALVDQTARFIKLYEEKRVPYGEAQP